MPFTFAHPAAVLPISRLTGRLTLRSALVIGSIVPDLWYVVPGFERDASHTWVGILYFCVPVGLAVWIFWRLFLQSALHSLYPPALQRRLPPLACWKWTDAVTAPLSLAIGAWTHLLWDMFTHDPHMEFLGNHPAPVLLGRSRAWETLLQYLSSMAGVCVVVCWVATTAYLLTRSEGWKQRLWPGRYRAGIWILLALSPVGIGGILTWRFVNRQAQEVLTAKGLVNGSARHMLAALAIELIVFAVLHRIVHAKEMAISRRS